MFIKSTATIATLAACVFSAPAFAEDPGRTTIRFTGVVKATTCTSIGSPPEVTLGTLKLGELVNQGDRGEPQYFNITLTNCAPVAGADTASVLITGTPDTTVPTAQLLANDTGPDQAKGVGIELRNQADALVLNSSTPTDQVLVAGTNDIPFVARLARSAPTAADGGEDGLTAGLIKAHANAVITYK